jgi:hypothetical protein
MNDPSMELFWKQVRRPGHAYISDAWRRQHVDASIYSGMPLNPLAEAMAVPPLAPMAVTLQLMEHMLAPHRAFWAKVTGT